MSRNKYNWIRILLVIAIFIVLWIFSGWNTYNADIENYEFRYYYFAKFSDLALDVGFYSLLGVLKLIGLSFQNARIILYGLSMGLICILTYKRSRNPVAVLLIFFAYHFVRDVVEMRHFIAFVVLFAFIPYVGRGDKRSMVILTIGILLAASFHISYISFMFLTFVSKKSSKNPLIYFPIFFLLSFIFSQFVGGWTNMLGIERLDEKLEGYLSKTHIANIASFIVVALSTIVVYYFSLRTMMYKGKIAITERESFLQHRDFSIAIYDMNVLSSVFILFSAVNFSFTGRLYGNIVFLNFIYIINYFSYCKNRVNTLDYIVLVMYSLAVYRVFSMAEMHYIDVFTNNSILKQI